MATKPMPRLRAGISGSPLISSAKRSLSLHVKSKSHESRSPSRHNLGVPKKEVALPVKKLAASDHVSSGNSDPTKQEACSITGHNSTEPESSWQKMCMQIDVNSKNQDLEKIGVNFDNPTSSSSSLADQAHEVKRLKQLMHLQISLISRQQDLLKLRDKEIMRLKTQTQSYENRLERMERRIQLSRRQSDSTNSSNILPRTSKPNKSDSLDREFQANEMLEERNDAKNVENVFNQKNLTPSESIPCSASSQMTDTPKEKLRSPLVQYSATPADANPTFSSPVSMVHSAYTASGYVPVPVSFLERFTTDQPSPVRDAASIQPVVVKVCEHCPQCSAIVSEIKQELPVSETTCSDHDDSADLAKSSNSPSFSHPPNTETPDIGSIPGEVVLQAEHPYYLITWPRQDQSYPFTDLEFSVDDGSTLNIPTWKTNKLTPLTSGTPTLPKEPIDDETVWKRHSRLEASEKRRKRWDIQRIREYRYNEKLRQKQLKQANDQCSIDSFSPSLFDITDIQVEETLPINVFGHSLEPLQKKEFSLDHEI